MPNNDRNILNRGALKSRFKNGSVAGEQDFEDLINSCININDDNIYINNEENGNVTITFGNSSEPVSVKVYHNFDINSQLLVNNIPVVVKTVNGIELNNINKIDAITKSTLVDAVKAGFQLDIEQYISDNFDANQVKYDSSNSQLSANNVQAAIDEIDADVDNRIVSQLIPLQQSLNNTQQNHNDLQNDLNDFKGEVDTKIQTSSDNIKSLLDQKIQNELDPIDQRVSQNSQNVTDLKTTVTGLSTDVNNIVQQQLAPVISKSDANETAIQSLQIDINQTNVDLNSFIDGLDERISSSSSIKDIDNGFTVSGGLQQQQQLKVTANVTLDQNLAKNAKPTFNHLSVNSSGTNIDVQRGTLHVVGDSYLKGHVFLYAFEGDGKDGTAYIQARDWKSGSASETNSNIKMQFRTQNTNGLVDAMLIDGNGQVGIGTRSPKAIQHIVKSDDNDYTLVETLRLERTTSDLTQTPLLNSGAEGVYLSMHVRDTNGTYGNDGASEFARISTRLQGGSEKSGKLQFWTRNGLNRAGDDDANNNVDEDNHERLDVRMTIDQTGKTGIGTTAPQAKLHVYDKPSAVNMGSGTISLTKNSKVVTGVGTSFTTEVMTGDIILLNAYEGRFTVASVQTDTELTMVESLSKVVTNTVSENLEYKIEKITGESPVSAIFEGGNVGIGTNNPLYKLQVSGDVAANAFREPSDISFKQNISIIENPLNKVSELQGCEFDWDVENYPDKKFSEQRQLGLIAQEVEQIIPQIVSTDEQGYKSVNYTKLIPLLIEAIKELNEEVKLLKEDH